MSINVVYTLICDECSDWIEPGFGPSQTRQSAKEAGWRYIRLRGWHHTGDRKVAYTKDLCPTCASKRQKETE